MTDHTPSGLPQPQPDDSYLRSVLQSHHSNNLSSDDAIKVIRGLFAARPAVETVAEQRALDKVRDIWLEWCDNHIQANAVKAALDRVFLAPLPVAPKAEPLDICTDSDNCNRCKRHSDHRTGFEHAGIPLGKQTTPQADRHVAGGGNGE